MGPGFVRVLSVAGIGSMLAISTTLVSAATLKECKEAYAAHKEEAKAAGQSEKAYIADCRSASEVMAPGATTAASHDAAASPGSTKDKIGKACEADYFTNKAAVADRGESKKDFSHPAALQWRPLSKYPRLSPLRPCQSRRLNRWTGRPREASAVRGAKRGPNQPHKSLRALQATEPCKGL